MVFRAVSLTAGTGQPEANKETAFAVLSELRASPFFDPDPQETKFVSEVSNDEAPGTFTFTIAAKLKHPPKL